MAIQIMWATWQLTLAYRKCIHYTLLACVAYSFFWIHFKEQIIDKWTWIVWFCMWHVAKSLFFHDLWFLESVWYRISLSLPLLSLILTTFYSVLNGFRLLRGQLDIVKLLGANPMYTLNVQFELNHTFTRQTFAFHLLFSSDES